MALFYSRGTGREVLSLWITLLAALCPSIGFPQWSNDPAVNTAICAQPRYQTEVAMVSDDSGGAYVTWRVGTGIPPDTTQDIYVQHVSASGNLLWQAGGGPVSAAVRSQVVPKIINDGHGGVIIVWEDTRNLYVSAQDIYAQRIDGSGNIRWALNGVPVCTEWGTQWNARIASDGAGGAIIAWQDWRYDPNDIFAQRIDSMGTPLWGPGGVPICLAPYGVGDIDMVPDGSGGAIMVWEDYRFGFYSLIFGQRVNALGVVQWQVNGKAICPVAGSQYGARVFYDGSYRIYVTWTDKRSTNPGTYAQCLTLSGGTVWTANGVLVIPNGKLPRIVSDGAGGAIISAANGGGNPSGNELLLQKINSSGILAWPSPTQASAATMNWSNHTIVSDGNGGAIVAWQDLRDNPTNIGMDIYAQHVSNSGLALWGAGGFPVSTAAGASYTPEIVPGINGGAIIAWEDDRNGAQNMDIYGQNLDKFGYTGFPAPKVVNVIDTPVDQGGFVTVSWNRSYLDRDSSRVVTAYTILKRMSPSVWESVATVTGTSLLSYSFAVGTGSDSTGAGIPYYTYKVVARTDSADIYWESGVDSGYSVDNVPPATPQSLFAMVLPETTIHLSWDQDSIGTDLASYEIFRTLASDEPLTPERLIRSTLDTAMIDSGYLPGSAVYYRLVRKDTSGNISLPSPEAMVSTSTDRTYSVNPKWNLISLPMILSDYHVVNLFPEAASPAYSYSNEYTAESLLANGRGYWVKFDAGSNVTLSGNIVLVDTIEVVPGWNLIGSIGESIDVADVREEPMGIISSKFFGYENGYSEVNAILPFRGYWVKANATGRLILSK